MSDASDPQIKIFISSTKECYVPSNRLLIPVQVGAALSDEHFETMYHDDDGQDNISAKNRSYCELTTQYWAWKNVDAKYYGFMHYRRYFIFNESAHYETNAFSDVICNTLNAYTANRYLIDEGEMASLIEKYDVIAPERGGFVNNMSIYRQYSKAPVHEIKDLDCVLDIIREMHPEFSGIADYYLKSNRGYFCNMFIMKSEIFHDYSAWLFSILDEFAKRTDISNYDYAKYRVFGYLAERLCGIYLTYLRDVKKVRFKELQRTLFKNVADPEVRPLKMKTDCVLCLSANERYVPYLSVMLESIAANSNAEKTYDIVVLTRDIRKNSQNILSQQISAYSNISLRFYDVSYLMDGNEGLFTRGHFSIETYYRYFIQDIFSGYEKVLYLDSDMIVNRDISELYSTNLGEYAVAAVRDADTAGLYNGFERGKKEYMDNVLKIKEPYDYFQAGTILFNLEKMKAIATSRELIEFTKSGKWQLLDQDVLNYYCQGQVLFLDPSWNVMVDWRHIRKDKIIARAPAELYFGYLESRNHPSIIHYAGPDKPWEMPDMDFADLFWRYARNSPYYEILLNDLMNKHSTKNHRISIMEMKMAVRERCGKIWKKIREGQ